jgi:hypothetical protein
VRAEGRTQDSHKRYTSTEEGRKERKQDRKKTEGREGQAGESEVEKRA